MTRSLPGWRARGASGQGPAAALRTDERGVAALEFAVIVPLFLLLLLGGFDAMKLVRAYDKTQLAAKTLSDLTSQEVTSQAIPQSEVSTLLSAAVVVATPYSSGFTVTVSAIDLALQGNGQSQTCCVATVRWSATQGGALRPCGTNLRQIDDNGTFAVDTVPSRLATQAVVQVNAKPTYVASLIAVDVAYANVAVTPLVSTFATRTVSQHDYAIPRTLGQVTVAPTGGSSPVVMTGLAAGQTGKVCS